MAFLLVAPTAQFGRAPGANATRISPAALPDEPVTGERLAVLLDQAQRAQRADLETWHRYSFTRQVTRQKLDSDGQVKDSEVLEFHVTPLASGFDEELIAVDGRKPDESLVAEHRKAARFSQRYLEALAACDQEAGEECPDDPAANDASSYGVQVPLAGRDFIHEGRETIDGVSCHRLRLLEQEPAGDAGARERVGAATVGTIWISAEGAHVVQAELSLSRPVGIMGGLARLADMEIRVATGVLKDGVRLPSHIVVRSELRVLGFPVRKRNQFLYTDFRVAAESSALF